MMGVNDRTDGLAVPVDYQKLLDERCRGKRELAARLLRNLSEDSGPRWVIDAEEVVKKGDMASVARIGHSVKGSCKMLYAENMVSAAIEFENAGKARSKELAVEALHQLKLAFNEVGIWLQQNSHLLI